MPKKKAPRLCARQALSKAATAAARAAKVQGGLGDARVKGGKDGKGGKGGKGGKVGKGGKGVKSRKGGKADIGGKGGKIGKGKGDKGSCGGKVGDDVASRNVTKVRKTPGLRAVSAALIIRRILRGAPSARFSEEDFMAVAQGDWVGLCGDLVVDKNWKGKFRMLLDDWEGGWQRLWVDKNEDGYVAYSCRVNRDVYGDCFDDEGRLVSGASGGKPKRDEIIAAAVHGIVFESGGVLETFTEMLVFEVINQRWDQLCWNVAWHDQWWDGMVRLLKGWRKGAYGLEFSAVKEVEGMYELRGFGGSDGKTPAKKEARKVAVVVGKREGDVGSMRKKTLRSAGQVCDEAKAETGEAEKYDLKLEDATMTTEDRDFLRRAFAEQGDSGSGIDKLSPGETVSSLKTEGLALASETRISLPSSALINSSTCRRTNAVSRAHPSEAVSCKMSSYDGLPCEGAAHAKSSEQLQGLNTGSDLEIAQPVKHGDRHAPSDDFLAASSVPEEILPLLEFEFESRREIVVNFFGGREHSAYIAEVRKNSEDSNVILDLAVCSFVRMRHDENASEEGLELCTFLHDVLKTTRCAPELPITFDALCSWKIMILTGTDIG